MNSKKTANRNFENFFKLKFVFMILRLDLNYLI